MAVSKAQLQLKRDLSKVQNELKKELFEEVRQLVAAYMQTEEISAPSGGVYREGGRICGSEAMTIYINPTDADKKDYLEEHTGFPADGE